jgi:biopolymer transport protein TolR
MLPPMIDILLVLLVIFMIIVPLEHGEMAEIPQPSNSNVPQPHEDESIVIQVKLKDSGGEPDVKINKEPVSWDKLEDRLKEIVVKRVNKTAFVRGDRTIDFQYVAEVIDTAHHAGVERIGLLDSDHLL